MKLTPSAFIFIGIASFAVKPVASASLVVLWAVSAPAVLAGDVVLSMEEPTNQTTYTGIANIRGWVVGSAGVNRVELYINGELKTNIPVGGSRSDVGAQYPNYPDSSNAGYSMAFNYSGMKTGQHTMTIRAVDNEGDSEDSSVTFNVARFDNSFISNPASINLNSATISHDGQSIVINNMTADGKTYDIRLDWRTAIQGYAIAQIIPTGGGGAPPMQGNSFTGIASRVWEDGFQLDTNGQSITVDSSAVCGDRTAGNLAAGEQVTVTGEFERGEFDAFSITRADGSRVCR